MMQVIKSNDFGRGAVGVRRTLLGKIDRLSLPLSWGMREKVYPEDIESIFSFGHDNIASPLFLRIVLLPLAPIYYLAFLVFGQTTIESAEIVLVDGRRAIIRGDSDVIRWLVEESASFRWAAIGEAPADDLDGMADDRRTFDRDAKPRVGWFPVTIAILVTVVIATSVMAAFFVRWI